MTAHPVLLTGATGYIGGRLLRRLLAEDRPARCLTRRPAVLATRGAAAAQIIEGDLLDPGSLAVAMVGVRDAYYLVHSMGGTGEFAELDRRAAAAHRTRRSRRSAGSAARRAGMPSIGSGRCGGSRHAARRRRVAAWAP
jgi:uncharacterized protein YbjT (DUF2867 family)